MDGFERASAPVMPILIQPGCRTHSVCPGQAGVQQERERGSGAPGYSGSWSQTGNIGHLDLEMKYCCWGGRRVQTSKYRDAANSSGWAVTTTGRERNARAGHASKTED